MSSDLNWGNVEPAFLIELMNEVSERDGIISFMYGGYGHYYAITARIGGRNVKVTAETPQRLVQRAYREILGKDLDSSGWT